VTSSGTSATNKVAEDEDGGGEDELGKTDEEWAVGAEREPRREDDIS